MANKNLLRDDKRRNERDIFTKRQGKADMPEYSRFKKRYSDRTANQLTQSIITWIKLHGGHAERINTMGRPIDKTKVVSNTLGQRQRIGSIDWIPGGGQRGSADIHSVINGRSVMIEVKIKDKQSEAQKAYQRTVERAGGQYWLIRSFAEFITYYKNLTL